MSYDLRSLLVSYIFERLGVTAPVIPILIVFFFPFVVLSVFFMILQVFHGDFSVFAFTTFDKTTFLSSFVSVRHFFIYLYP